MKLASLFASSSIKKNNNIGRFISWFKQRGLVTSLLFFASPSHSWITNTSLQPPPPRGFATTTAAFMSSASSGGGGGGPAVTATADPLASIRDALDNSWIAQLSTETPENHQKSLDRMGLSADDGDRNDQSKRPVLNGHYVRVRPTGLRQPRLLLTSESVATEWLHMTREQLDSDALVRWVSGNLHEDEMSATWATPYALSIMGTRYTHNCPFGDGTGYGDGRAIR